MTFSYEPGSFAVGLFLSLLACAGLAGGAMGIYLRKADKAVRTAGRS